MNFFANSKFSSPHVSSNLVPRVSLALAEEVEKRDAGNEVDVCPSTHIRFRSSIQDSSAIIVNRACAIRRAIVEYLPDKDWI